MTLKVNVYTCCLIICSDSKIFSYEEYFSKLSSFTYVHWTFS